MKKIPNFSRVIAALLVLLATLGSPLTGRADWVTEGDITTFTDNVGYSDDLTIYSGTVSLQMRNVLVSGQWKIVTTILFIEPAPGFTYSVKKSGGVNGAVEIEFNSATSSSKFSFLYKPGTTRIDYGEMRSR